ncbi:hypothetical protein [Streptomyces sp. NPDC002994]|uniref:hypothetical protein n=1 Tax=Streptomyces sp. NPDC002994 TaxID=3154441 RepID=UPI0033BE6102
MTKCIKGDHDFPVEDATGAYCGEHEVTLLWHGPPITPEDLTPEASGRICRAPARTCLPGSAPAH